VSQPNRGRHRPWDGGASRPTLPRVAGSVASLGAVRPHEDRPLGGLVMGSQQAGPCPRVSCAKVLSGLSLVVGPHHRRYWAPVRPVASTPPPVSVAVKIPWPSGSGTAADIVGSPSDGRATAAGIPWRPTPKGAYEKNVGKTWPSARKAAALH